MIVYAHYYNQKHDCTYFSTTIFPIWDLNRSEINGVLSKVWNLWLNQYFHVSVLLFIGACFLFNTICFGKSNKLLIFSVFIILIEAIAYILLQFWTFAHHDYYTINMYILPILIIVSTFDVLKRNFNKVFSSPISKGAFSLFLVFNIYYANQKINERYDGWMNSFHENKDIYSITNYLRQIGISSQDTIISIPDNSHASLYLMNQKGWTEYTDTKFNKGKRTRYNQDSDGIQSSIDKGAKYLIVNGIKELYSKPYLKRYCNDLVGYHNDVLIFNLKSGEKNFDLEKRTINKVFNCNAELVDNDMQYFISTTDGSLFKFGKTQNEKFAHGGKYSSKIDANSSYGMTIKFRNLKNGESFEICVWRKATGQAKGGIIASSVPNQYFYNDYNILETDSNGWEKICMEFFISPELTNQELIIYVYNPNSAPVYFDDLEIIRYKSVLKHESN